MRRNPALISLIAALGAFSAAPALAQMQPDAPRPAAGDMHARHEAHARQRAQDLRIILRLRPDQDAALNALMTPPREPPMAPPPSAPLTTPQRLDQMAQHESRMMAAHQAHLDAVKTFYAALSPDQRQVFDALMRVQGPHGMPGMGGMSRMGGMRGMGGMHGMGGMPGMGGPAGPHPMGGPPPGE